VVLRRCHGGVGSLPEGVRDTSDVAQVIRALTCTRLYCKVPDKASVPHSFLQHLSSIPRLVVRGMPGHDAPVNASMVSNNFFWRKTAAKATAVVNLYKQSRTSCLLVCDASHPSEL
jgi:hypothetical protein